MPLLWDPAGHPGRALEAKADPHSVLRSMPQPDPDMVHARTPGPLDEVKEEDLQMIAAATRYLYRCRRAGDDRPTGDLLCDLVSEADAGKLERAVSAFFDEERLS
jgi:hypothetical protein